MFDADLEEIKKKINTKENFYVNIDSLIVEPNLSTGTMKSTVKIEATDGLYTRLIKQSNGS